MENATCEFVNDDMQPLHMEVPQVATFFIIIDSLKAMSLPSHVYFKSKFLDYRAITIEFMNSLFLKFNGDII
jgi:hypothetical protein